MFWLETRQKLLSRYFLFCSAVCCIAYFIVRVFPVKSNLFWCFFFTNPTRTHCVLRSWFWRKRDWRVSLRRFRRCWRCRQDPGAHPGRNPSKAWLKIKMPAHSIIKWLFTSHIQCTLIRICSKVWYLSNDVNLEVIVYLEMKVIILLNSYYKPNSFSFVQKTDDVLKIVGNNC